MNTRKILTSAALLVASLVAAITALVAPANASSSYLYNQHGTSVLTLCTSGCGGTGTPYYAPNGKAVSMFCYFDASGSSTGNYSSNRYFEVYISGKYGLFQVHSSYVYYQTGVPHC